AKIANAHDFISQTEKGYETNIGDRGGRLSGGQRQRVSIARAILKNPPILILDEATSALDTESERLVQDALYKLMKMRTTIAVAHRLSTIKNSDEICVMHEGEIVERGTHDELMQLNGYYKKLHDMQEI
ncbi:ATP-binding cassette domain-containing protein, partial [Prevotella aurantiaca]|uniref:ATP-binding cassette domain-containing protein n=1 Tax=Prevotella aurantiaca TaxID=596085 RepID=UPI0028DB1C6A